MQRVADWIGQDIVFTQDMTLRFPLLLTLAMAILTLWTALQMREPNHKPAAGNPNADSYGKSIIQALNLTSEAGHWILKTPFALVIILAGLLFDNCIRMLVTLASQYYRLINLPEASFGLISSGISVLGLFIPWVALKMVTKRSAAFNLCVMVSLTLVGLIGVSFVWPIIGLLPVILIRIVMYLQNFFQSHYLNRITNSEQRATVLSFKGLSFNLAYGFIGVLYSLLLAMLRSRAIRTEPFVSGTDLENLVFVQSLTWFPWYFILTMVAMLVFARWKLKNTNEYKIPG
jgi:hypothetical protein